MSNLTISTQVLTTGKISLKARFNEGETPKSIFLYENNGTEELGRYIGVANIDELVRYKEWTGQPIPSFGNRYVRYNQVSTEIDLISPVNPEREIEEYITVLSSRIKTLENLLNMSSLRISEIDTEKFSDTEINDAQVGTRRYPVSRYYNVNPLRISVVELVLDTNSTMNISPGIDGQELIVRLIQGRGSVPGNPNRCDLGLMVHYSTNIPSLSTLSGGEGLIDELTVRYNKIRGKWILIDAIYGI